jgi:probable rRNA maturation factor
MSLALDIQLATEAENLPGGADLKRWASAALAEIRSQAELVIRIVDESESRQLNRQYRGFDKPTNVLSFPFDTPTPVESDLLGDLVICAPVVEREALEQGKPLPDHWAHMVVHGVLHLTGHDHQTESEAQAMEQLERRILKQFDIPDPYRQEDP